MAQKKNFSFIQQKIKSPKTILNFLICDKINIYKNSSKSTFQEILLISF